MNIEITVEDATDRQLLVALYRLQLDILNALVEGNATMADVATTLANLTAAVDEVGNDIATLSQTAADAIAAERAAQAALVEAQADDAADAARIAELEAALAAAQGSVNDVLASVDAQAARLKGLVPDPEPLPEQQG